MRKSTVRAAAACALALAAAGCSIEWPECGHFDAEDPGVADAGLGVPKPLQLDIGLIDAAAVAVHYEGPTRFVASVLRQDYASAQEYFDEIAAMQDATLRMREIYRLKFAVDNRGMSLLTPARQWLGPASVRGRPRAAGHGPCQWGHPGERRQLHQQEHSVENWPMVDKLATQAIALNPQQTYSYAMRGLARQQMGRPDDAWRDTLAAAVLGSDEAMGRIVDAHLDGTLGVRANDGASLVAYCKMGAAFGLPTAAYCMGASTSTGLEGVPRNNLEAVRWHLLAARGGNSNSQHDLGTLLPVVKPGKHGEAVARYWMGEAARQGHKNARNRGRPEGDTPTTGFGCMAKAAVGRLVELGAAAD